MNPFDADEADGGLDASIFKPIVQVKCDAKFIPAYLPTYGSLKAAGADLQADLEAPVGIQPGRMKTIPTGIYVGLPDDYELQIRSRSGLAAKNGVFILNSPGTIDEDYLGQIFIMLANFGEETFIVKPGMRIAQAILAPYVQGNFQHVDVIQKETIRGAGGLGSTGV